MLHGCRTSNVNAVYEKFLSRVQEEFEASTTEYSALAIAADIPIARMLEILQGSARGISLREITGISLALGIPLENLLS